MIEFIFYQGKRIMEHTAYCKHTQSSHTTHSYPHNQKGEGKKKKRKFELTILIPSFEN